MRGSSKRGVSAVVATVLIVMITVAAVGLLWTIVSPFLKTSIADKNACVEAEMSITVDTGSKYNCVSSTSGTSIRVARGSDEETWLGVQIVYTASSGDSTVRTYANVPTINSEVVYGEPSLTDVTTISVAPILEKEGDNLICSKTIDIANLRSCTSEVESVMKNSVTEDDLEAKGTNLRDVVYITDAGVNLDDFNGDVVTFSTGTTHEEDCISDSVCLARDHTVTYGGSIFNSISNTANDAYHQCTSPYQINSISGTQWAHGTCDNNQSAFMNMSRLWGVSCCDSLSIPWVTGVCGAGDYLSSGRQLCMYVEEVGLYYDVTWISWTSDWFSYNRTLYGTSI